MKDVKYHLYFSYQEQSQLLKALINLKNELIAQGKYHEPVDELIIKITKARRKKLKII
jgi:putative N-acetylmannosamine-6-phosphate epimerase